MNWSHETPRADVRVSAVWQNLRRGNPHYGLPLVHSALLVLQDAVTMLKRNEIIDFAIQKRLPSMFQEKGWALAGGLMSYGENLPSMYRRAAYFVDKIFKGAKPDDLPVEQATKFDLVINLGTARKIGLTIPDSILGLADDVIE